MQVAARCAPYHREGSTLPHEAEQDSDVVATPEDRLSQGAVAAAGAAADASERAVDAIERAAEKNDDPTVADELRDAALHAESAATRVGWLRSLIRRILG
jgi:hypothetical protein